MIRSILLLVILSVLYLTLPSCGNSSDMISPNGKIKAVIEPSADCSSCGMRIMYCPSEDSVVPVLSIRNLGFTFNDTIAHQFAFSRFSAKATPIVDDYQMISGKTRHCVNQANEYTIELLDNEKHPLQMTVRVYNNGVAFRYTGIGEDMAPAAESTTFVIPEDTKRWMSEWDWNLAYERLYPCSQNGRKGHYEFPFLVEASSDCFALVTESGIESCNSASSIFNLDSDSLYVSTPDINSGRYSNYSTPWRVVAVGHLSDIVENTLVTDLAMPCRIADTSWIKPGVVSWIYWAYNHGSKDYQIVRQYIDMAARLNLPYVLIDAEWDEMANGGDITDAIAYAREQGVDCLIWYNSSTAWVGNGAPGPFYKLNNPDDREKEFAWLEQMGVKGVKIDFFKGDTQETMAYCIDLLESAARHHLMVNFHGATLPRGWQRTYPNLLSTEAVRGAEWYNNGPDFTEPAASHNATLPFTRNVVGSMDYTPCTFSNSQFPHITTNAHELALTVVFESALQHLADKPESYYAQPMEVQRFLSELPSTWDETRLLSGYPGEYAVVARRKGSKWYIGCVNGLSIDRYVELNIQALQPGLGSFTIFTDQDIDKKGWNISKTTQCPISMKCLARGGFVVVAE